MNRKIKKMLLLALMAAFVLAGAALSVYYAAVFSRNTAYTMQLILSVICAAEAIFTAVSAVIYVKNIRFRYAKVLNGISFLLCLQVALFVFMWVMYLVGADI